MQEFDYSLLGSTRSQAIIDPRFGTLEAKLVEYITDTYHGTQKRIERELPFQECDTALPKYLKSQTCILFKQKR